MAAQIFISHITAERELAFLLKERIESDFLGMVEAFVSSDQKSIEAGESWLDALRRALERASLQVVLCSPASILRPWVNFEAGAAWLKGIPVAPLCHSGLTPEAMPMPLNSLQGGQVSDPDALQRLYARIAKLVPCKCPAIDWHALAAAAAKCEGSGQAAPAIPPKPASTAEQLRASAEAGSELAIQDLAISQTPEAFAALMDVAVNHIDEKVKIAAIKGLATFRTPGDLAPLFALVVNQRWLVAEACAKALARFKDPAAIPYLVTASDQHVDWVTTREAASALGAFAPQQPAAVCPALVRALDLGTFEAEAASQSLRRYGALALPYLLDALRSQALSGGIGPALKTIGLIGDRSALPALQSLQVIGRLTGELAKAIAQLERAPG